MPGSTPMKRVLQKGVSRVIYDEADAAEAIIPGHVVELDATGKAIKNLVAGGTNNRPTISVAVENDMFGKGLDDAYAIGDRVVYATLSPGDEFLGIVAAAAAAIAFDAYVTTAGDGTLAVGTAVNSIGRACEAVDNSAGATAVRLRVKVGN